MESQSQSLLLGELVLDEECGKIVDHFVGDEVQSERFGGLSRDSVVEIWNYSNVNEQFWNYRERVCSPPKKNTVVGGVSNCLGSEGEEQGDAR